MSIFHTAYKDRPAVAVKSDTLTALILPMDGGKMASLKTAEGHELLAQAPGTAYRILTPDGSYVDAECSGFDDMFPTIDHFTHGEGECAGIPYPDHGEVCRLPAETEIGKDFVRLCISSRLFPIAFEKRITSIPDGSIDVHYTIRNNGRSIFRYIWAAHCMLAGEDDAQIITPFHENAPVRMMFGPDQTEPLSRNQLGGFSENGATYKYYHLQPIPKGIIGYRYPLRKEELLLQYDEKKIPFLGIWLNNGGFKNMYNIALEPCTAPFDRPDMAKAAGYESVISAGGSVDFSLRFYWHQL